jgi:hypothetical protein
MKFFLRQLANEYSDMELLSSSIGDKSKAQDAINLAKEFRATIRACDEATKARDFDKVLVLHAQSADQLKRYLGYLHDVPDEL